MYNVDVTEKGMKLTVVIDMSQDHGPSKSGKTNLIASTEGNIVVGPPAEQIKLGLNVYKPVNGEK